MAFQTMYILLKIRKETKLYIKFLIIALIYLSKDKLKMKYV